MKKIKKNEPDFYREFTEHNKPGAWGDLSKEIGYDIRVYMLTEEQNFQCAYTEIRLEPEDSHTDHLKNKVFSQD